VDTFTAGVQYVGYSVHRVAALCFLAITVNRRHTAGSRYFTALYGSLTGIEHIITWHDSSEVWQRQPAFCWLWFCLWHKRQSCSKV